MGLDRTEPIVVHMRIPISLSAHAHQTQPETISLELVKSHLILILNPGFPKNTFLAQFQSSNIQVKLKLKDAEPFQIAYPHVTK